MKKILLASLASIAVFPLLARSANVPLEEATITRIVNDVRILDPQRGSGPARVSQVIKDDMAVRTGVKSRAELLFQDNTLTRLGAESFFTFRPGTREMSLDSGTLLLQVPKDHGGATIRSASITASVTGTTIMLEAVPKKSVKVVVLEGSLRVSMNNRLGESLSLRAGKMIILQPGDRKMPEPVTVDLRRLIRTSSLVNPALFSAKNQPKPLPSMPLIASAISEQDKQRARGDLQDTNLVILGKGTKVVTLDEQNLKRLDGGDTSNLAAAATTNQTNGSQGNGSTSSSNSASGSGGSGTASGSGNTASPIQNTQTAASSAVAAGSGNAQSMDGQTVSIGTRSKPQAGDVDITSPVFASSGTIPAGSAPKGKGGVFNIFTSGRARIASTVEVSGNSPDRMSATGGSIHIESLKPNSGTGIELTNTSQLLSLLNAAAPGPGGRIEFVTSGSMIQLGGKVRADRGSISAFNNGVGGQIKIDQANMAANVVTIGALQADGALRIRDSHISADSLLQLYGGTGNGGVFFEGNTLLDGSSLKLIAGREVKINNTTVVTIGGGPAAVFTDKASFATGSGGDGSTTGRFERQTAPGVPYAPAQLPYVNRP